MSNVALARPSSVATPIISCSVFGTAGSDFYIKVMRSRIVGGMVQEKTTGDGDDAQSFDMDYMPVYRIALSGFLVAYSVSSTVASMVANLIDTSKNPLSASWKIKLATSVVLAVPKMNIHQWEWGYSRDRAVLPISLSCTATNTTVTMASS